MFWLYFFNLLIFFLWVVLFIASLLSLLDLNNNSNGQISFSNLIDYRCIKFCNIHAFKGMEESSAILIWDKEDYETKDLNSAHLFYTALTRVLNEVYILLISEENKALNFNE